MNQEIEVPLTEEQRQSPVAILVIIQRLFITIVKSAWPLFFFYFINPESKAEYYLTLVGIGAVLLSTVGSLIAYFNFYFQLGDTELVMRSGLFNKTYRNIPFERIQTINFTQNIVHRLFNVVQLDIDTAGSGKNELAIKALSKTKAQAIRSFILQKKEALPEIEETTEHAPARSTETSEKLLLQLSISDLIKIGISQNHLRTLGIILATFFGLTEYVDVIFPKATQEYFYSFFMTSLVLGLFIAVVFIFLAFLLTLIRTVFRYYDLRFVETSKGFKLMAGLLTRHEQSAQTQKIQLLEWSTNPLKKYFGLYTLYLKQAASTQLAKKETIMVPGCYPQQIQTVRQTYFPDFNESDFTNHRISPLIIGRYTLYFGVLPALILFGVRLWSSYSAFIFLLWIPLIYWLVIRYHQKWRYHISERGLFLAKGMIGEKAAILLWYKVQAVHLKQSRFQRRKQLATLKLDTAGGSVELPYIELDQAEKLRNFVLYEVERGKEKWM